MKIKLSSKESIELLATGSVIIEKGGFGIVITQDDSYASGYSIRIISCLVEVVLNK